MVATLASPVDTLDPTSVRCLILPISLCTLTAALCALPQKGHSDTTQHMIPILLDKSTLQMLSSEEASRLTDYYHVVYCPTLFSEIMADLKKETDKAKAVAEVRKTATKISGYQSYFTTGFRTLVFAELLGNKIEMMNKPLVSGGVFHDDPQGGLGYFLDEQPEFEALRRWTEGNFTKAEELMAENWRSATKALNYEQWKKDIKKTVTLRTIEDLIGFVDLMINDQSVQELFLHMLFSDLSYNPSDQSEMIGKWISAGRPDLKTHCPYTHHCIRIFQTFYFGLSQNLIGTRPTNRVDIEYLLYLPFCRVFSSEDNLLKLLSPYFLRGNDFIGGKELKVDLASLAGILASMSTEDKALYRKEFGKYPPGGTDSFTTALWLRYFGVKSKAFAPIERNTADDGREKAKLKELQELAKRGEQAMEKEIWKYGKRGPDYSPPPRPPN